MTWNDALNYCKNLNEYSYSHWRLPNIDEVRGIIINCPKTEPNRKCKVSEKMNVYQVNVGILKVLLLQITR